MLDSGFTGGSNSFHVAVCSQERGRIIDHFPQHSADFRTMRASRDDGNILKYASQRGMTGWKDFQPVPLSSLRAFKKRRLPLTVTIAIAPQAMICGNVTSAVEQVFGKL
jgi:hypothetical protein